MRAGIDHWYAHSFVRTAILSIIDTPTALIAIGAVLALWYIKKMQEPYSIGIAALLGLILI